MDLFTESNSKGFKKCRSCKRDALMFENTLEYDSGVCEGCWKKFFYSISTQNVICERNMSFDDFKMLNKRTQAKILELCIEEKTEEVKKLMSPFQNSMIDPEMMARDILKMVTISSKEQQEIDKFIDKVRREEKIKSPYEEEFARRCSSMNDNDYAYMDGKIGECDGCGERIPSDELLRGLSGNFCEKCEESSGALIGGMLVPLFVFMGFPLFVFLVVLLMKIL